MNDKQKPSRGEIINSVVAEMAFRKHLRKLAEQRERRLVHTRRGK